MQASPGLLAPASSAALSQACLNSYDSLLGDVIDPSVRRGWIPRVIDGIITICLHFFGGCNYFLANITNDWFQVAQRFNVFRVQGELSIPWCLGAGFVDYFRWLFRQEMVRRGVNSIVENVIRQVRHPFYLTNNLWNAYKITAEINAPTTSLDNHIIELSSLAMAVAFAFISAVMPTMRSPSIPRCRLSSSCAG